MICASLIDRTGENTPPSRGHLAARHGNVAGFRLNNTAIQCGAAITNGNLGAQGRCVSNRTAGGNYAVSLLEIKSFSGGENGLAIGGRKSAPVLHPTPPENGKATPGRAFPR